ncbi:MAG: hypothetical protein ACRCYU_23840 [Nocardioides sp.]
MYDNDQAGYVFCVLLVVGHVIAWAFWHFCARGYYHAAAEAPAPVVASEPAAGTVEASSVSD